MTLLGLLAGLGGTLLLIATLLYRAAWMMEREDAKRWERRARAAGWHPEITPVIADRIMGDLFGPKPVPLPPFSYPLDLIIGTLANPIHLDRSYTDSSLNDTAVASTLSDLVRGCGGRL